MKNRLNHVAVAALLVASSALMAPPANAQAVTNSALYYRMGGGSPGGAANNRGSNAINLGLSGSLRLNYSCGKFDLGLSWQTLMNGFSQLGTQVSNAVKAGIASLPLYIFQRAQPGLYQLFQHYSAKADVMIAASLKTCEEMEAMIKAGKDPYEDWVKLAKGETWKEKAHSNGDVVQAKLDINKDEEAQKKGVNWVFGKRAGGTNSDPLRPVRDLSIAGYNVTLNKATTAAATTNYSAAAEKNTRLVRAFPTPDDLAKFTTAVLGDRRVYTCTQGTSGCPTATNVITASGLGPRYEAEYDIVSPKLQTLATAPNGPVSNLYAELQGISAPGMSITPQLMEALRGLPPEQRSVAANRLAQELSMHRVVDKALVARAALLTGMSLPEVSVAGEAMRDTQETIDRLTHYIDDLMYESRIRKELTGDTAMAIMAARNFQGTQSLTVPEGRPADPYPLQDGRVKP